MQIHHIQSLIGTHSVNQLILNNEWLMTSRLAFSYVHLYDLLIYVSIHSISTESCKNNLISRQRDFDTRPGDVSVLSVRAAHLNVGI